MKTSKGAEKPSKDNLIFIHNPKTHTLLEGMGLEEDPLFELIQEVEENSYGVDGHFFKSKSKELEYLVNNLSRKELGFIVQYFREGHNEKMHVLAVMEKLGLKL